MSMQSWIDHERECDEARVCPRLVYSIVRETEEQGSESSQDSVRY